MQIIEKFLTPNKYSRPQIKLEKVTAIAVHYVGNPNTTAINNRNYFENQKNGGRYVSSHYIIGLEGEIIQCIPANEWSYCTNQANGYSISIECCHPDSTGKFTEATEKSLIELCAFLCDKFNLTEKNIIRHYDVTGKQCPLWYVPTKYQSEAVVNERWNGFKNKVALELKKYPKKSENIETEKIENNTEKMYYVQVGMFTVLDYANAYLEKAKKKYSGAFIKTISGKYYVQVGAFKNKNHADNFLKTVKKDYPESFIKIL